MPSRPWSQIATNHKLRRQGFLNCRNLWLWHKLWRHKLSPMTLETCFRYLGEYPGFFFDMNMKSWKAVFLPILVSYHWYICLCVCISGIKPLIDVPRKPSWKGPIFMFSALRSIPSVTMKSIWEVVFWTVTICNSHKLRQFRKPCRRNLWFVAICDQGRDGTNWVQ